MVRIEPVETRRDWRAFLDLPWQIYRNDPCWVPAMRSAERRVLDPRTNPFFDHAQMRCFTARRDGQVCGRIAAISDENYNRFHQEQTGFFGFFEVQADYEAAAGLLQTARDWLGRRGLNVLRGPVSPSTNYECGTLIEGFDSSPVVLMSYNPRYYLDYYEQFGLAKARDLHAYWFDLAAGLPPKAHKVAERARRQPGLTVRSLDARHLDEEILRARKIFDQAWERNWGFVPLTDAEWEFLAHEFRPVLVPDMVLMAEVKSEPVGFVLTLPDINPVLKGLKDWRWPLVYVKLGLGLWKPRVTRMAMMGMVPEYQNLGIAALLYEELYRRAQALGYQAAEFSWILEDNTLANRSAEAMGGRRYKSYRIYEMSVN
jgi:GNAT superfamily N-acetyltransferase